MTMKSEVNAVLIVTTGVASALLLLVIIFGTQAWFLKEEGDEITMKWEVSKNAPLDSLRAGQRANIGETRWADKDRKVATIPISQAVQVLVENGGKVPSTQPAK